MRRKADFDGARAFFDARLKEQPDNVEARIELARTAVLQGEFDEARRTVEPLLRRQASETREKAYDELALIDLYQGTLQGRHGKQEGGAGACFREGGTRGPKRIGSCTWATS